MQLGLLNFDVSLLTGKEEDDYWEKLRLDRESRKKTTNKKKKPHRANNGFKKIVDRATGGGAAAAATAIGSSGDSINGTGIAPRTHMRFDDD